MEEGNLSFQYAEIQAYGGFLESMNSLLKDSDAAEEKELIRNFLRKTADTFSFVVIGDSGVGKTSLLEKLFGGAVVYGGAVAPTVGIREFRYGEADAEFRLDEEHLRIFSSSDVLKGISVIDMQGYSMFQSPAQQEKVRNFVEKSDVLIVVFQADAVNHAAIWDLLENVEARKVVCVLTKADLFPADVVDQKETKARRYLAEAGIEAPVFCVSALPPEGGQEDDGCLRLKEYIGRNVLDKNPRLQKQRENIRALKEILGKVSASFLLRKKQYEADAAVAEKINRSMDGFLVESREKIDLLKDNLRREIDAAIDAYETEIISKLNPRQIKERFPNGYTDFVDYLQFVNEGYRRKMTDNVNRKTQETVRAYLSQLELVFEEATGYFQHRESLVQLEDHFYGSMAKSKQEIVVKLGNDLQETRGYYGSLMSASEELFLKIWSEGDRHRRRVGAAETIGGLAGSAAGIGGMYGAAALLQLGAVGVLWPVVAAVVGGVVIASMAKKVMSARSMEEMEVRVREAVEEFRTEVSATKGQMTAQIMETIEAIFQRELDSTDKTFLDFRKSVNIDSRNIPALEDRMQQIGDILQKIEQAEKEKWLT